MAIVPFRVSGRAADQSLESRTFQLVGYTLRIRQAPAASGSLRPLASIAADSIEDAPLRDGHAHSSAGEPDCCTAAHALGPARMAARQEKTVDGGERLENVGLVVWQSGFVLAELLLRRPPFGQWRDVHVVDLGSGTGVVGLALALAGADVTLTDLAHVLPLTEANLAANCTPDVHRARVAEHRWGDDVATLGPRPDLITGGDVAYQPEHFPALVASVAALSAPHTITYVSFRRRGRGEAALGALLEAAGFAVCAVPLAHLHEEYQGGEYAVLRACALDGGAPDAEAPSSPGIPQT